jgi:hypothetical protein
MYVLSKTRHVNSALILSPVLPTKFGIMHSVIISSKGIKLHRLHKLHQ